MRNKYKIFVIQLGWKRPLGRLKHRWEDNIKMCFHRIRYVVYWFHWAQDAVSYVRVDEP
jgi:hypothetical protein